MDLLPRDSWLLVCKSGAPVDCFDADFLTVAPECQYFKNLCNFPRNNSSRWQTQWIVWMLRKGNIL